MDNSPRNPKRQERKKRRGVVIPSTFFNRLVTNIEAINETAINEQMTADNVVSMPRSFPPQEIFSTSGTDRPRSIDSCDRNKAKKRRVASELKDNAEEEVTLLGEDFEPGKWHVVRTGSKNQHSSP